MLHQAENRRVEQSPPRCAGGGAADTGRIARVRPRADANTVVKIGSRLTKRRIA
jgi:hypothetical protein